MRKLLSLALSLLGCGVGWLLARGAMIGIRTLPAGTIPRSDAIAIRWTIVLVLAAVAMVTTVLPASAFATSLSPTGPGAGSTPTFTWTAPSYLFSGGYTYQFQLTDSTTNTTIWQIPSQNSKSNGISSSITSITWGADPTGANNPPMLNGQPLSSLTSGDTYNWTITVQDSNGNTAQMQTSLTP